MAMPKTRNARLEEGIIKTKNEKASSCILLLCVTCQVLAKQARQGPEVFKQIKNKNKDQML
jgi:hypothetical protein